MQYPIKYYIPHLILFGVYLAVLIPFLYYYRRRNPHPRFRPTVGEVTMVAVILMMIGGTACWFLGNVFSNEKDSKEAVPDHGAGWSGGTSGPSQDSGGSSYRKE